MDLKKYIGIPFKDHGDSFEGCDCYGLVRLVYAKELGIELPHLGDQYSSAFARREIGPLPACTVAEGWAVDVTDKDPEQWDVLVFSRGGVDYHVGLFLYGEFMLHAIDGTDSCLEKWNGVRWKRQLTRRLRHASRVRSLPSGGFAATAEQAGFTPAVSEAGGVEDLEARQLTRRLRHVSRVR